MLCRPDELHRLWELLLAKLADKGMKLQQALVLVQFLRQYDEVMFWIHDKVSQATPGVSGHTSWCRNLTGKCFCHAAITFRFNFCFKNGRHGDINFQ